MTDHWTTFEGRPFRFRANKEPRVTIGKKGTIYMNRKAHEALGQCTAVELLFDGERRMIGLKRTDPKKLNAFRVMPQCGKSGYRRISAASFCQHFRLNFRTTRLFDTVEFDHKGMMLLDLNKTTTVTRGAR